MGDPKSAQKARIDLDTTRSLFVDHRETIREVLKRVVQEALLQHKRAGNPVVASENGEIVWIPAEQIRTDQDHS